MISLTEDSTIRYLELIADSMPNYGKRYRGGMRIEAVGECPLPKVHQTDQAFLLVAIPETPFGALQLGEGVHTNAAFREAGSTFCGVLKISKSHRDVKLIENVLETIWFHRVQTCPPCA
jgi:hypothetical protein